MELSVTSLAGCLYFVPSSPVERAASPPPPLAFPNEELSEKKTTSDSSQRDLVIENTQLGLGQYWTSYDRPKAKFRENREFFNLTLTLNDIEEVTVLCVPVSLHWHTHSTQSRYCVCRCHYTGTHSTQSRYCVCAGVITLAHTVHSHGTVCAGVITLAHTVHSHGTVCVPVSLHWHTQYTVTVLCVCRCHYTGTHST